MKILPKRYFARRWLLVFWLCTLAVLSAQAADVYKWVDDKGRTHYTDQPPVDLESEELEIRIQTITAPPVVRKFDYESIFKSSKPAKKSKKVIMYSTAWCGVCKQAKAYFKSKKIRYVEYDVEKSSKGRADFKRLNGKGVPIILVGNRRMDGFSPRRFEAMRR